MKIVEFIKKNQESLPSDLAKVLIENESIWTNDACFGYCIFAMQSAGVTRKKIADILHHLHIAFGTLTVEEAEQKWYNF